MSKKVVIAGGGIAGTYAAKLLENDVEVTLIDNKDYFEFRIATPRAFVEPSVAEQILIPHSEYLKKAKVVVGVIKGLKDNEVELEDGTTVPFDYLILATGSKINPALNYPSREDRVKYFQDQYEKVKSAKSLLIVGGGPVGVEIAAEVLTDLPEAKITIVHSGERLCEYLKPKASEKLLKWLQAKKVEVLLNDRVDVSWDQIGSSGDFTTSSGKTLTADYLYIAIGGSPDVSWLEGSLSASIEGGRVKVEPSLRVEGHPNIFAIGDITNLKEAKLGYLAKIHASTVVANIKKLLKDESAALNLYKGMPDIGLVSLGRKDGLAQLPFGTFTGWLPANLKSKTMFVPKARADLGLK